MALAAKLPRRSPRFGFPSLTRPAYQRALDRLRDPESIGSPSPELVVELLSKSGARYTTTDTGGRFLFDGLAEGTYKVSVYEKGYPGMVHKLAGPREVDVTGKGCANTVLVAAPQR